MPGLHHVKIDNKSFRGTMWPGKGGEVGFSDGNGPPSPFAEEWLGAELCGMKEGTRSALASPLCCEDPSEVFVQCKYYNTMPLQTGEKLECNHSWWLGEKEDFFSVATATHTLLFNFSV